MKLYISANLKNHFPGIEALLKEIGKFAKSLDKDIRTRDLYVEAKCCPNYTEFGGTAHPFTLTYDRRWGRKQWLCHPPGKITMSIGIWTEETDVARLFGHELRHIGQFKRGSNEFGHLTIDPLALKQAESDAYEFEEYVAERF
jgi:hypothetical protein